MEDTVEENLNNTTTDDNSTGANNSENTKAEDGSSNNQEQEDETVAKTEEEKYDIQHLIDNCEALGYKKEVVTGALLNCKKNEMTKNEFIETVKSFLGKEVK